jgi:hypothetical protein
MKVMFWYNERQQKHKHIHQVLLLKKFIKKKDFQSMKSCGDISFSC